MLVDDIEKLNLVILLVIDVITLVRTLVAIDFVVASQRDFSRKVIDRLDSFDNGDRS